MCRYEFYNSSGFVQVIAGDDSQLTGGDERLGVVHARALQAHYDGHVELQAARRLDDALRDRVAAHDTAEDVHQDGLHLHAHKSRKH